MNIKWAENNEVALYSLNVIFFFRDQLEKKTIPSFTRKFFVTHSSLLNLTKFWGEYTLRKYVD